MFGKKKKNNKEDASSAVKEKQPMDVSTIPDVFYGGKDPEIYHEKKHTSKKKQGVDLKKEEEKEEVKRPPVRPQVQTGQITKAPTPLTKKSGSGFVSKKLIIIGIGLLIILGGVGWYYVSSLPGEAPEPVAEDTPQPAAVEDVPSVVVADTPEPVVTTTTLDEEEIETPTSTPIRLIEFPPQLFVTAVDLDQDELTDVEEEIFRTDSGVWDTDLDGYYDGQEVVNLYNPSGTAPEKIIDSGLVREYVNATWQYRVYYPAGWQVDAVDDDRNQVLFSTISGDYIEIQAFEKDEDRSFLSWFGEFATGQQYSDLEPKQNRFQIDSMVRDDQLVGYYVTDTAVFVLVYHPGVEQQIMYPHVMRMMLASFRPVRTFVRIPDQPVLPQANTPSSTEGANTPVSATSTSSTMRDQEAEDDIF